MSPSAEQPLVGVVGGSRSDFPILEDAVAILAELGVPAELRVVSAHRTPDHLFRYAEEAPGRGIRVIVAGAGGAAPCRPVLAAEASDGYAFMRALSVAGRSSCLRDVDCLVVGAPDDPQVVRCLERGQRILQVIGIADLAAARRYDQVADLHAGG